jgi:hypothetical protein
VAAVGGATFSEAAVKHRRGGRLCTRGHAGAARTEAAAPAAAPVVGAGSVASEASARGLWAGQAAAYPIGPTRGASGGAPVGTRENLAVDRPPASTSSSPSSLLPSAVRGSARAAQVWSSRRHWWHVARSFF